MVSDVLSELGDEGLRGSIRVFHMDLGVIQGKNGLKIKLAIASCCVYFDELAVTVRGHGCSQTQNHLFFSP